VTWRNSHLAKGSLADEVQQLKQGDGPDIIVFGSGTIIQQLADEGLIDDYFLIITPAVVGAGKPLFKNVKKFNLELQESTSFKSGNVLLHYTPAR
jgi:dihydrofolate reductase